MAADDSIAVSIRNLRFQYLTWSKCWGPENLWEKKFSDWLEAAKALEIYENTDDYKSDNAEHFLDDFLLEIWDHAKRGRKLINELSFVGAGECEGEYGVFIDLFVQTMDLTVKLVSEVKFFEVKLDEYALVVPQTTCSKIRYIPAYSDDTGKALKSG